MSDETFSPPSVYITPPEGWFVERATATDIYYYKDIQFTHIIKWVEKDGQWWVIPREFWIEPPISFKRLEQAFEAVQLKMEK
jgi:hypothetical protein